VAALETVVAKQIASAIALTMWRYLIIEEDYGDANLNWRERRSRLATSCTEYHLTPTTSIQADVEIDSADVRTATGLLPPPCVSSRICQIVIDQAS
jgi:hypothetical protein